MEAIWNGVVVAKGDTIQVEGNEYFRLQDCKTEYFVKSETVSFCGWKGTANYYNIVIDGKTNKDCAWYYAEPNDAAKKIKGMVAFWNGINVR